MFGVDDHWGPLQMFEEVCEGCLRVCMHVIGVYSFSENLKGDILLSMCNVGMGQPHV